MTGIINRMIFPKRKWPAIMTAVFVFGVIVSTSQGGNFKIWPDQAGAWVSRLTSGPKNVTVQISSSGYSPSSLQIELGDKVTFQNIDNKNHWPASNLHPTHDIYPEFDPKQPVSPNRSWSFTFTKVGQWRFHDHLSPDSGGVIVVRSKKENSNTLTGSRETGQQLMSKIEQEGSQNKQLELMKELTLKVGPELAVELLNASKLPRIGSTHLLSHQIGVGAYELFREKALPLCSEDMLNGCAHGLILTAISDIGFEGVKRMVGNCQELSVFKYHMCLHAAGHAFTALNEYDILASLKSCDNLINPNDIDDIDHCYNGAFMENVLGIHNGLTPDKHPFLSLVDLLLPCNKVGERYQSACYLNQSSWWYSVTKGDLRQTATNCNLIPDRYLKQCANSLGRVISTAVQNDRERIKTNCQFLNSPGDEECMEAIGQSVFALGDENLPFQLCQDIKTVSGQSRCFGNLIASFKEHRVSSQKMSELCAKIPNENRSGCLP